MKFGQLIGYNVRNIFLEKLCTKCGWETIDPFLKIKIEHIQFIEFYTVCFYCMLS